MRARNIKPAFFKNEGLADLPAAARLLFVGLWCMADKEGRLEDRPKRIKAELFPYENINVEGLLTKLEAGRFIHRYGDDPQCIVIPKFKYHQNPHKNEAASVLPAPDDIATLREDFVPKTVAHGLIPSSLIPDSPSLIPESVVSTAAVDNELLDELLDMAAGVKSSAATWEPTKADRKSFAAMAETFPPEQLRRELGKFKAYAPQRDYKLFGKTFVSWMGRVVPEPFLKRQATPRDRRIANAVSQLEATGDESVAKAMCNSDEWSDVLVMVGAGER